jgi:hypothetical protein
MRDSHRRLRSVTAGTDERRSMRRQWECAILLSGALAVASFAPHPIVLPIVSVVLIVAAAIASGYAWFRAEPHRQRIGGRNKQSRGSSSLPDCSADGRHLPAAIFTCGEAFPDQSDPNNSRSATPRQTFQDE